jgi:hypothetical protein
MLWVATAIVLLVILFPLKTKHVLSLAAFVAVLLVGWYLLGASRSQVDVPQRSQSRPVCTAV